MSIAFGSSAAYFSTATNLPSTGTCTVCGFGVMTTDTNTYTTLVGLDNASSYMLLTTLADGTTLKYMDWLPVEIGSYTMVPGTPFFFGYSKSGSAVSFYARSLDTAAMTTASGTGSSAPTATALYLGTDGFAENFVGQLFGVKIWNAALSAAEMYQESLSILPARSANLQRWYPCVDNSAASCALDFSGNGYNLTVSGSPTIGQGGPVSWGAPLVTYKVATAGGGTTTTISVSGGVNFAGVAAIIKQLNILPQGGVAFGGAASISHVNIVTASGGILFTGNALIQTVIVINASGGIVFAGDAIVQHSNVIAVNGGVEFSGIGFQGGTSIIAVSGGIIFSGAATIVREQGIVSSGGVQFSGQANQSATIVLNTSGGIQFSGNASVNVTAIIPVSSGVTFSGDASIIFVDGSGGAVLGKLNRLTTGVARSTRLS